MCVLFIIGKENIDYGTQEVIYLKKQVLWRENKMRKKMFLLIRLICLMALLSTFTACNLLSGSGDNQNNPPPSQEEAVKFEYEIVNGEVTITRYLLDASYVSIPEEIDGYPVKKIAAGAFSNKERGVLDSGEAVASSESVEQNKTIYIPGSITTIEEEAFANDKNFYVTDSEEKPEGWKDQSITSDARDEKNQNGNIYFESNEEECVEKDDLLFVFNNHTQGYYVVDCFNQSKEIKVPNNIKGHPVNNIGQRAFQDCFTLEKVSIPKGVTYIWHEAFMNCTSLKEVEFDCPALTKIRYRAFYNCSSLNKIKLPENLIVIEAEAFKNCGTINEITIPTTLVDIGSFAFENTTIVTAYYKGDEQKFSRIRMGNNAEVFAKAEIVYSDENVIEGITEIKDLKNLSSGTIVTVRGYVACFLEGMYEFLLIDEENQYGVVVYVQVNDPIEEMPVAGDYIELNGSTSSYGGMFEISMVNSIEKIGEKTLTPQKVTSKELNDNSSKYLYRYIEMELTVITRETYYTTFEGVDIFFFNRKAGNPLRVGDEIIFRGTVGEYGNVHELMGYYDQLTIVSRIPEDTSGEKADLCLTVELLEIPYAYTVSHYDFQINGVTYVYNKLANNGYGIQFGPINEDASYIFNATAFEKGIAKIVITYSADKHVYDNNDAFCFSFGNSADDLAYQVFLSSIGGTYEYVITPDTNTYTFFKMEKTLEQYNLYIEKIEIYFA